MPLETWRMICWYGVAVCGIGSVIFVLFVNLIGHKITTRDALAKRPPLVEYVGAPNTSQAIPTLPHDDALLSLIKNLEAQLAGGAAEVKFNEPLEDTQTGEIRSVPILIRAKAGVHSVVIAVHVATDTKPLDPTALLSILGKYDALGITKIVVVSKSGFDALAVSKSRFLLNVELLTFASAAEVKWPMVVTRMARVRIESFRMPELKSFKVIADRSALSDAQREAALAAKLTGPLRESVFVRADGSEVSATVWINKFLSSPAFMDALQKEPGNYSFEGRIPMKAGTNFKPAAGILVPMKAVDIKGEYQVFAREMEIAKATYGSAVVGFAQSDVWGERVTVAIAETEGEQATIAVSTTKLAASEAPPTTP